MKALMKTSIACLCSTFVFFCAWQYLADPRAQAENPAKVLGQISRAFFGERCRETYRIDRRADAIAYARTLWKEEELKLALLGDDAATRMIFRSVLFRDGGD